MADETAIHFIQRRTQEVSAQIAALEGQLAPLKAELEKLNKMRAIWHEEAIITSTNTVTVGPLSLPAGYQVGSVTLKRKIGQERYDAMSIKELIIQAFLDKFWQGARAVDIRSFIPAAYRRNIEPTSLRSALHRLKNDGVLHFDESNDMWHLNPDKRNEYALYDHPSRRRAMPELRDDDDNKE